MSTKFIVAIFSIVLLFTSCKKRPDCCEAVGVNEVQTPASKLQGKWLFNYFVVASGFKEKQPKELKQMSVSFIDSFIVFKGQRNFGEGIYYVYSDNRIKIKEPGIFSTMAGVGNAEAMEWEEKFYNALNIISCYKIKKETLILSYQEDGKCKAMYFTKE